MENSSTEVKIVKFCRKEEIVEAPTDQVQKCPSIALVDLENFLDNVDEEILYVDGSIDDGLERKHFNEEFEDDNNDNDITCFEKSPLPLSSQIDLPIQDIDSLLFCEIFMISKETFGGRQSDRFIPNKDDIDEMGSCSIMTEKLDNENILIYFSMKFLENNKQMSQEVLSVVDKNLKVVHEKRIERFCDCERLTEKSLHIISTSDGFRMTKTETKEETTQMRSDVKWTQEGDFLSYGANVLMLRQLIKKRFIGCIQSYTIDIEGEIFLSQQWFHPPEATTLLNQKIHVQRVDRLTLASCGQIIKQSSFFISESCCLLKEINSFNDLTIHLNPFTSNLPPRTCVKSLHENWESDLQLMSMYLEFKSKRKEELKQQMEHPRMKSILRDYVLCLVKSKPSSVMNFTLNFVKKLERDGIARQVFETADRRHQQN